MPSSPQWWSAPGSHHSHGLAFASVWTWCRCPRPTLSPWCGHWSCGTHWGNRRRVCEWYKKCVSSANVECQCHQNSWWSPNFLAHRGYMLVLRYVASLMWHAAKSWKINKTVILSYDVVLISSAFKFLVSAILQRSLQTFPFPWQAPTLSLIKHHAKNSGNVWLFHFPDDPVLSPASRIHTVIQICPATYEWIFISPDVCLETLVVCHCPCLDKSVSTCDVRTHYYDAELVLDKFKKHGAGYGLFKFPLFV